MIFAVRRSPFAVRRSPFAVRRSPKAMPSSFIVQIHPSPPAILEYADRSIVTRFT
jgi:hypothetical protein